MSSNSQTLICDPETGACELPASKEPMPPIENQINRAGKVKIVYFTDPICSSCWGIEPQLRKMKLEYGDQIEVEYRMGGLLPDWSYNSGGISKPSDVAHHWDEVSLHYDMPIDGDVWLEDPLDSSYPPSIAFKAAQQQDEKKALDFLRTIREMVFLKKTNITKWKALEEAAAIAGLNVDQFEEDYKNGAKKWFEEDLLLARQMGVRGFPSMFFTGPEGHTEFVYGSRPYPIYEKALHQALPGLERGNYASDWVSLFSTYPSLTAREYAELSGMDRKAAESVLTDLAKEGKLQVIETKNGSLWSRPLHTMLK